MIRLTPEQFEELLLMISPIITRNDTFMRPTLPARLKLEIALAFRPQEQIQECCQLCSEFFSHLIQI